MRWTPNAAFTYLLHRYIFCCLWLRHTADDLKQYPEDGLSAGRTNQTKNRESISNSEVQDEQFSASGLSYV